jgi:hypothetical protein
MPKKPFLTNYANASLIRFKNRRLTVFKHSEDINKIVFERIAETDEDINIPASTWRVIKCKIVLTEICLSDAGVEALYLILKSYLENKKQTNK